MDNYPPGRRAFLRKMTALGAVGLPVLVHTKTAYDREARFEIKVSEVEVRRTPAGRMLMARIYQPIGAGPFPTVLDLHGGAWNAKDRHAEEPMDRALAASGVLVVAIDLTLAPEAPYPACVQDANYGVRWLKWKAASWNGDPSKIGIYGSSSGGHVAELLGMRPRDARYNAIPLPEAPKIDATVAYIAMRSPISDPFARFQHAQKMKREPMIEEPHDLLQAVGNDLRGESAADPRSPRKGHAGATADHAGCARRQRAAGCAGEICRALQGCRRRLPVARVRRQRTRVGRHAGAANRPRPRDGQSVHRASVEGIVAVTRDGKVARA